MTEPANVTTRRENWLLKKEIRRQQKTLERALVLLLNMEVEARRSANAADRYHQKLVRNIRALEEKCR